MTTATRTREIAFTVPLLPGKTEIDRREMRSCWNGQRAADHAASRRRLGITREAVWIQEGPDGDRAVVHMEAEDIGNAFAGMAMSEEPFDRWFRDYVLDVHGLDIKAGFPPPEQVLDFRG